MTDAPRWFRLAYGYPVSTPGISLPFLVGALREPIGIVRPLEVSAMEFWKLLDSIKDGMPGGFRGSIRWANALGSYALFIGPGAGGLRWQSLEHFETQFETRDFLSFVDGLWALHAQVIGDGRFSRDAGGWRPFTSEEVQQIHETLQAGCP